MLQLETPGNRVKSYGDSILCVGGELPVIVVCGLSRGRPDRQNRWDFFFRLARTLRCRTAGAHNSEDVSEKAGSQSAVLMADSRLKGPGHCALVRRPCEDVPRPSAVGALVLLCRPRMGVARRPARIAAAAVEVLTQFVRRAFARARRASRYALADVYETIVPSLSRLGRKTGASHSKSAEIRGLQSTFAWRLGQQGKKERKTTSRSRSQPSAFFFEDEVWVLRYSTNTRINGRRPPNTQIEARHSVSHASPQSGWRLRRTTDDTGCAAHFCHPLVTPVQARQGWTVPPGAPAAAMPVARAYGGGERENVLRSNSGGLPSSRQMQT